MENPRKLLNSTVEYIDASWQPVHTVLGQVDQSRLSRALPVRRPPSYRAQKHYPGLFWSATTGDHVVYESRLELARLWFADFSPDVTWIASQPMWLRGWDESTYRQHVPDLLLTSSTGQLLVVDVKSEKFANHPRARAIFNWTSQLCSAKGWDYQVWTEADCDPVELANIQSLAVARRTHAWTPREEQANQHDDVAGRTLRELAGVNASRATTLSKVWSGQWVVDLKRPLNWQSKAVEVRDLERN